MYLVIIAQQQKIAESLLHGSPKEGLSELSPNPSHVLDGEHAVFATPSRGLALSFAGGRWNDADLEQGALNSGPLVMRERRPNAFSDIYDTSGNLYEVDPKGFGVDPRLTKLERINNAKTQVTGSHKIDNVLKELEKAGVVLKRYNDPIDWDVEDPQELGPPPKGVDAANHAEEFNNHLRWLKAANPPPGKFAADAGDLPKGVKPSPSRELSKLFFKELGDNDGFEPLMTFASERRDNMREKVLAEVKRSFPIEQGDFVVELKDAYIDENEATPTKEREALLVGNSLMEHVRGHIVLRKKTGEIIDEQKDYSLAKLPFFTDDHSFIIEGTHYTPRNQLRTRSGVFTRKRGNDDIEASFNLAKGANFRLALEPEKGKFNMEFGTTKIPLYPVLKALGKSHDDIAKMWGPDLARMNAKGSDDGEKALTKLYEKVIPSFARDPQASFEKKVMEVRNYFDKTQMDAGVNKRTLGEGFDKLSTGALVVASKKLLDVFQGNAPVDDRDSLEFQKVYGVEDFLSEKIRLDRKDISSKIKTKIRFPKKEMSIKSLLPANTFGKGIQSFITTSSVITTPTNINPLERMDNATTITRLGEGAIGSERAIPMEARRLHGSHIGILGPLRTPESSRAGIDVRSAVYAAKDKNGVLHTPLLDLKTNKVVYKAVDEITSQPIAFPEQETRKGNVDVIWNGKVQKVKPSEVRYQLPNVHSQYSIGENLIPMLESVQGNRGLMASKMVTQALPLVHAEEPRVQVSAANSEMFSSMEEQTAAMIEAVTPVQGTVAAIDADYIHVKSDKDGRVLKIPYKQNMPYAKTRFHQEPIVKVGDKVRPLQQLTKSNFTRNGKLALGTNLRSAYIADHGYNTDDAITISESAAQKLTSEHMTTYKLDVTEDVKVGQASHAVFCPNVFTKQQYSVLDSNGVVKKGQTLKNGDPVFVAVRKTEPSAEDRQLGKLHKSLVRSHIDISEKWDKLVDGEVVDVIVNPNKITVTILSKEPAKRGDKIAGLYGNKGVIGRIIPDHEMLKGEDGKPMDVLMTSAGVISRINPGQTTVSALGKAAAKTGDTIVVKNFDQNVKNNVTLARDKLIQAGLDKNGKETLIDPVTGRKIPKIFVGENYVVKLFKTTESNFAGRNVGGYDSIDQPLKGGDTAAKSTGGLEVNALLAHNARGYLSDVKNIKAQRNGNYWRAVQLGHPAPPPEKNFAVTKFWGMLKGSGINVDEKDDAVGLAPLTDDDIMRMSSGEIVNEKRLRTKDLRPEEGGLFDPSATGGAAGNKWSHIDLKEPMLNPVFFEPARRLLGKTKDQMMELVEKKNGNELKMLLNNLDTKKMINELEEETRRTSGLKRDNALKAITYLKALDKLGKKAGDAYMLTKFPVVPPVMRPILPAGSGGSLIVDDANFLYRDLMLSKNKKEELEAIPGLPPEFVAEERKQIFGAMSAIAGLSDPISPQSQSRKAKGFLRNIAGTSPKYGYLQSKIIKSKMDLSGSATVALNPKLGVDEVEIPEEIGWRTYQPFIVRRLVQKGMKRVDAIQAVEEQKEVAKQALYEEAKNRPMVINRAPSLHRFSMLGVVPKFVPGKTIRVNPYLTDPMNMDFDGDSIFGNVFIALEDPEAKSTKNGADKSAVNQYKNMVSRTQKKENTVFKGNLLHAGLRAIDIKDFPRIEDTRAESDEGKITYDVPKGVVVPAVDKDGNWGLHHVTKFHIHPKCHRWDVVTHLGRELICSANHSMVVLDENTLELVKCRPRDAIKKCVPVMNGLPDTDAVFRSLEAAVYNSENPLSKGLIDEIPLDKDFGWFLGVYIGDGWNTTVHGQIKGQLCLSYGKNGEAVPPRWHRIAKTLFVDGDTHAGNIEMPHEFDGKEYTSQRLSISSKALCLLIDALGMGHGAQDKRLPTGFLQMPLEFRRGLFEGLMDTDGSISITQAKDKKRKHPKMNVGFTTTSPQLASEILLLGQSLGLIGNVTTSKGRDENRQESHYVTFTGRSICDADWLSLTSQHKQAALEEAKEHGRNPSRNNIVPFPVPVCEAVLGWLRNNGATKRKDQEYNKAYNASYVVLTKKMKAQERYITREQLSKISDACAALAGDEYFDKWFALCNNADMSWDYVKEAKDTRNYEKMYDLTIPNVWTFTMANGLAVWDTAMLSVPVTEEGRKDVHNMMLSKQLFSDKSRGDLLVAPKHESLVGWTKATEESTTDGKPVKKFKNMAEAMAAYKNGSLKSTDIVEIG